MKIRMQCESKRAIPNVGAPSSVRTRLVPTDSVSAGEVLEFDDREGDEFVVGAFYEMTITPEAK